MITSIIYNNDHPGLQYSPSAREATCGINTREPVAIGHTTADAAESHAIVRILTRRPLWSPRLWASSTYVARSSLQTAESVRVSRVRGWMRSQAQWRVARQQMACSGGGEGHTRLLDKLRVEGQRQPPPQLARFTCRRGSMGAKRQRQRAGEGVWSRARAARQARAGRPRDRSGLRKRTKSRPRRRRPARFLGWRWWRVWVLALPNALAQRSLRAPSEE